SRLATFMQTVEKATSGISGPSATEEVDGRGTEREGSAPAAQSGDADTPDEGVLKRSRRSHQIHWRVSSRTAWPSSYSSPAPPAPRRAAPRARHRTARRLP